jgi:hypothetical protein
VSGNEGKGVRKNKKNLGVKERKKKKKRKTNIKH